jgi:hypothetical protein
MAGRPDAASARNPGPDGLWTFLQVDQQRITALDTVSVAIRGWVVTLDSTLTGFALTKADPGLIAVAIAATLLFLPLDLQYRRVQLGHADRVDRIEQQVADEYQFRSFLSQRSRLLVRFGSGRYAAMAMFYAALLMLLIFALIIVVV